MGGGVEGHLEIGDILWVSSFRGLKEEGRLGYDGVMLGTNGIVGGQSRGGNSYRCIHGFCCLWLSLCLGGIWREEHVVRAAYFI